MRRWLAIGLWLLGSVGLWAGDSVAVQTGNSVAVQTGNSVAVQTGDSVVTQREERVAVKRQMRGAWIATVANIDWPQQASVGNYETQRLEMVRLLDNLQRIGINTVIFQVRPTADALYRSELEPWSKWLVGDSTAMPDYDPLAFVVEEAHKRCMDVHVWVNPYRGTHRMCKSVAANHALKLHPDWFIEYEGQHYFNPALQETRDWLCKVVVDIVKRYDIDAVHMDDYFYPYPNRKKDFPDTRYFAANPRGFTEKADWRRDNVNLAIKALHDTIAAVKPWVEFGVSPFGIWRNQSSDSIGSATAGLQNYDDLYADILLWLREGWIDYVAPQLYWEIGKKVADYQVLLPWWAENAYGRNLYIGLFASALGDKKQNAAWMTGNELCRQMRMAEPVEQVDGFIFYSSIPLLKNPQGICDSLTQVFFADPALHPICRNKQGTMAFTPRELTLTEYTLSWMEEEQVSYYVVYFFPKGEVPNFDDARFIYTLTRENHVDIPTLEEGTWCVTTVNRYKRESLPASLVK